MSSARRVRHPGVRTVYAWVGVLGCLVALTATPRAATSQQVTLPLSMRLVMAAGDGLVFGRLAANLKVAIRNTTPLAARQGVALPLQAIVLRGVHWAHERDDDREWLRPLPGKVDASPDGALIIRYGAVGGTTDLAFETGLLLPGEELTVAAPMTPQPGGRHELVVRYAVLADGKDWMGEVLLAAEFPRYEGEWYRPATAQLVAQRRGALVEGSANSFAIVRSTRERGAAPLKIQTKVFPVQILSDR